MRRDVGARHSCRFIIRQVNKSNCIRGPFELRALKRRERRAPTVEAFMRQIRAGFNTLPDESGVPQTRLLRRGAPQPRTNDQFRFAKPGCAPFTHCMQLQFILNPAKQTPAEHFLTVGERRVPMNLVHNPRARRYVLRLRPDGSARVTIPRGGSAAEARRFAERNVEWLERELQRIATRSTRPKEWLIGTEILLRGEPVKIEAGVNGASGLIRFGSESVRVANPATDLRPAIERHLWKLAARELPPKVIEYATIHQLPARRITVRNQRSRWGSCSRRGTISLNWRLIQAPPFVRDYLILHELMHLREMNHSPRFWRVVGLACPDYEPAERWLKQHSVLLR
jgi:predicted metal-dependent hydrolase